MWTNQNSVRVSYIYNFEYFDESQAREWKSPAARARPRNFSAFRIILNLRKTQIQILSIESKGRLKLIWVIADYENKT